MGVQHGKPDGRDPRPNEPAAYRLMSAAGVLVAELVQGREGARRGGDVLTLELLPDVAVRKSAGGDLLLYLPGEARGKTPAEALESGWAREPASKARRAPPPRAPLNDQQVGALHRAFDTCVRPAARNRG